jgi:exosortase
VSLSSASVSGRTLGFLGFSAALILAFSPTVRALVAFSLEDRMASSQIVVVPFVTAALLWLRRGEIFSAPRYAVAPGAAVLLPGVALLAGGFLYGAPLAEADRLALVTSGLVTVWLACFVAFYGTETFRKGLFPLLFLIFTVPIPTPVLDATIAVLQRGSADMAYVLLILTGTPVYREGFIFALPGLSIEIAPECSGIRSGIGMLMTSLLAGYLMLRSWTRRAALVMIAVPLLMLKNAIRIDTLSLLSIHVDPGIIEGRLHHEGGIVFFALGLVLLYPVLLALIKSERRLVHSS